MGGEDVTELDLTWREMQPDERVYVLSTWIKSYATGGSVDAGEYARHRVNDFARDYAPVVRALVDRSRIAVACFADQPSLMVGWLASEGDVVHYLATKPNYRRMGVATWMLHDMATLPAEYTHETRLGKKLVPPTWVYRRWRIWPKEQAA